MEDVAEEVIVLDTHALAWASLTPRKLGRQARRHIDRAWEARQVAVSAISFWEMAFLHEQKRVRLPASVEQWRADLLGAGFQELPIDGAIGIRAVALAGLPRDPADRLICATALHHHATLVTADEKLLAWEHALARQDASR